MMCLCVYAVIFFISLQIANKFTCEESKFSNCLFTLDPYILMLYTFFCISVGFTWLLLFYLTSNARDSICQVHSCIQLNHPKKFPCEKFICVEIIFILLQLVRILCTDNAIEINQSHTQK